MSLYFLSNFNEIQKSGDKSLYSNYVTGRKIYLNHVAKDFIHDNILNQQLDTLEEDAFKRTNQIILAELLYRGIVVPEQKSDQEEVYLRSLILTIDDEITFFNSTKLADHELESLSGKDGGIIFCGVPCDLGAKYPGTRFGPELLRSRSSSITFRSSKNSPCLIDLSNDCANILQQEFVKIHDFGNIYLEGLSVNDSLAKVKKISSYISQTAVPFFIGGDHLFTLPLVEGVYSARKKPFTLVQFDYHLDIQLWGKFDIDKPSMLSTPTHANFISWIHHKIPDLKICQLGIDNYQSVKKEYLKNTARYLSKIGNRISNLQIMQQPIEQIIQMLPLKEEVYLSIDVDVLNSAYMSMTGYPSATGISFENLLILISQVCKRNTIIGVDIMEFGKSKDYQLHSNGATMVTNLILEILKNISQL
jgi:agmatinase